MRRRSAASKSHSKTSVVFASSERSRRKTRSTVQAPFEENNSKAIAEPIARNARASSTKRRGLSQRSQARTNAPFGLFPARRKRSRRPVKKSLRCPPNHRARRSEEHTSELQ